MSSVTPSPEGLLDTNIFIHAMTHDAQSEECRRFLLALEEGRVEAWLDPLVLHELSYVIRTYLKQSSRESIARYLLVVLQWQGILGDKDLMVNTVERWRQAPGVS